MKDRLIKKRKKNEMQLKEQGPEVLSRDHDEYNALIKNSTWILVPKPPNVNVVQSMSLFRHKYHADGSLSRYKARLVANGCSQQFGIDCDEPFSLVVKPATIRTVLSLTLSHGWHIHRLDVKNAFLNEDIFETIYMYQPPVTETAWLHKLLPELHSPFHSATLIYCDNVRVLHVPSRYQYAHIFTKGLPSPLFEEFRTSLSVRSPFALTAREC
nr:ribonuclease H-like domain-containing protein [Tanacetum cinerariifolium]